MYQKFLKLSIILFHENQFSGCRVVSCVETDRWTNIEKVISNCTYGRVSEFNQSLRKSWLQEPLCAAIRRAVITRGNVIMLRNCERYCPTQMKDCMHIVKTNSRHVDMDIFGYKFVCLFCNALKSVHNCRMERWSWPYAYLSSTPWRRVGKQRYSSTTSVIYVRMY
jgi:hypothetical protein